MRAGRSESPGEAVLVAAGEIATRHAISDYSNIADTHGERAEFEQIISSLQYVPDNPVESVPLPI